MVDSSILIIGAGPVGLAAALELGSRGQDVVVVESGDGVVDHPRAGGLSIRTMEFCRRWGITDQVRNCGFPLDHPLDIVFSTGLQGYELIREHYPALRDMPVPAESPERRQRCPQMWFDPIMAKAASRHASVRIRYRTRLDSLLVEDDGTVRAACTDVTDGSALDLTARYALACDGAASPTRSALGIELSGTPLINYSIGVFFRSEKLVERAGQDPAARFIFVGPDGPIGNLTVVDGADLWRFTYIAGKERPALEQSAVEDVMRGVLGDGVDWEILSIAPWRRSQLVADYYRRGPVFLVGDSAHTMSPTGGFGANTGIGEAVDIGWKLDAVLRGWAGDALLDSYEAERRPVALRNSAAATANFDGWYSAADLTGIRDDGPAADALRVQVGRELLSGTRAEWESKGVILGYRYEDSPVCVPDGTPAPEDDRRTYVPTTRPGHRAPHRWLGPDRSTLDLFGSGFVLIEVAGAAHGSDTFGRAAAQLGIPLRREVLPPDVADLYTTRLTLVRPDGHVAWRGDQEPADAEQILMRVTGRTATG